jgi:hypothetical protein
VDTWRFRKGDAIRGNTLNFDAPWPPEPVICGLREAPRGPKKGLEYTTQEPQPKKPDLLSRFRKKIIPVGCDKSPIERIESDEGSQCSMPIPDAQDGYGAVIQIHNPTSW